VPQIFKSPADKTTNYQSDNQVQKSDLEVLNQDMAELKTSMIEMSLDMRDLVMLVDTVDVGRAPQMGAPNFLVASSYGTPENKLSVINPVEFIGAVQPGQDYEFEIKFKDGSDIPTEKETLIEIYQFSKLGQYISGPYPHTAMSDSGAPFMYLQDRHLISNKAIIPVTTTEGAFSVLIRIRAWLKSITTKQIHIASVAKLMRKGDTTARSGGVGTTTPAPIPVTTPVIPADISPAVLKPRSISVKKLRGLYILDEISELNWAPHFDLHPLKRGEDLKAAWDAHEADFLFLESCWNGNQGDWEYAFTSPELKHRNCQQLLSVLDQAADAGMTTYFWNKEDPLHFDKFLPIAKKCSVIGTTDSNMLPRYKDEAPNSRAQTLPFAASPTLCNPTDRFRREPEDVCFAGTYYVHGHNDRRDQMDAILQAVVAHNGAIYDRYSHLENDRYEYPDMFKPYLRPSVPFKEVVNVYKQFRLFLNVNTIVDSKTMMSRRVYEILATGTPVLSTPSLAIDTQFDGIVPTAGTGADAIEAAGEVLGDDMSWRRLSHLGYREVHTKHTYHQHSRIIETGVRGKASRKRQDMVSIVTASVRPENVKQMMQNAQQQSYPNVEVIYVVTPNFSEADINRLRKTPNVKRTEVIVLPMEETLGQCLNAGVAVSKGDYIAKFDDDNLYLENYLIDMLLPFEFDDYWIVGKEGYFCYLEGHNKLVLRNPKKCFQKAAFVSGDAMIMKRKVFEHTGFPETRIGEDTKLLRDVAALGGNIYSADYYNFVKIRNADLSKHTWKESEDVLMRQSEVVSTGLDLTEVAI